MKSNPLVSVIIPSYNHQNYVAECINSVLNQSYQNIELIVIDDGSNDKSVEIIEGLSAVHPFIFKKQKNIGLSATLNKAISKYASGKYIAMVASDDFWHPDKIKIQVEFLEQNPNLAMCCTKAVIVDKNSQFTSELGGINFERSYSFKNIALGKSFIPALTVLIKKEIFKHVGLFDEHLLIEDLDMWLRISKCYPIGYIDVVTASYRQHGHNVSLRSIEMAKSRFQILEKWTDIQPALYKKVKRNFELLALGELAGQYPEEAKKYLNINLANLFHTKYRRFILRYLTRGSL